MPFWTLFLILGITVETTQLIRDFALTGQKEFNSPSFLFNYIIGPVNGVLQKYREYTQKSKQGLNHQTACRARIQQLIQFDLTRIIIKFLIKEFENDNYNKDSQAEITTAIEYVNKYMEEDMPEHTKPNKISLIVLLGYCDHIGKALTTHRTSRAEKLKKRAIPFDASTCHPASIFEDFMNRDNGSIPGQECCIPESWNINNHMDKIRSGEFYWEHVFNFEKCNQMEIQKAMQQKEKRNQKIKKQKSKLTNS